MTNKCKKLLFLVLLIIGVILPFNYLNAEERDQDVQEIYIIKKGDTLWDISEKFLKDPFRWPDIWQKNDYISNPDLIYPGNKLLLWKAPPPVLPERVEKEVVKAKIKKLARPRKKVIAKPSLPQKVPVTEFYILQSAGFIVNEDFHVGSIVGSAKGYKIISEGNIVYADVGPEENALIGKRYSIYRLIKGVKHPINKKDMGYLVKILGELEIKDFQENVSSALITKSYEEISENDLITDYLKFEVPLIDPSMEPPEKDIQGYIILTKDEKRNVGMGDVVYLDVGSNQGVEPGDRFIAYQNTKKDSSNYRSKKTTFRRPKITIGELKIISIRDETSTALVTKSVEELDVGNEVKYNLRKE